MKINEQMRAGFGGAPVLPSVVSPAMALPAVALLAVALLAAPAIVSAQGPPPPGGPGGPPPWDFAPGGGFGGKVVTGVPYSAVGASTFTQKLADGNTINRTNSTNVYRDGSGRTRREETLNGIGPLASSSTPRQFVVISDPVAGYNYVLNPQDRTYRQMRLRTPPTSSTGTPPPRTPPDNAQLQTTDLGTKTINGVAAQGTQTTLTIPAGQIGNQQAIVVTSTRWVSSDLQVVVQSARNDPRMGSMTYNLTNIQRGEPSPALFQLPPDYTLQQGGPRDKGAMRGQEFQGLKRN